MRSTIFLLLDFRQESKTLHYGEYLRFFTFLVVLHMMESNTALPGQSGSVLSRLSRRLPPCGLWFSSRQLQESCRLLLLLTHHLRKMVPISLRGARMTLLHIIPTSQINSIIYPVQVLSFLRSRKSRKSLRQKQLQRSVRDFLVKL